MLLKLVTTGLIAMFAYAPPGPSQFYIVSEFFSDYGAAFYYRVLDVRPDGPDTLIRYIRVAPLSVFCERSMIVQSAEAVVRNESPAKLLQHNNLCAIRPIDLKAAIQRYPGREGAFETISFGIVAQCGDSLQTFAVPIPEKVNLKKLKAARPEFARLWDLTSDITDRAFGDKDNFHDRSEEDDAALQKAGAKLVPELISGRYDRGLTAAHSGNVGRAGHMTFRSLLKTYGGPISASDAGRPFVPTLVNANAYRFDRYIAPKYPPLAMQARIQGKVELQLTVQPATGEVEKVIAISGHPILTPAALEAAKHWHFEVSAISGETLNVTLDFALTCPGD